VIKTVLDAFEQKADLIAMLDRRNRRRHPEGLAYDTAGMEFAVTIPDQIALYLIETLYLHNTHFVPGKLPGNSMAVGDIVPHNGGQLLTADWRVLNRNVLLLHAARAYEARCLDKATAGADEAFEKLDAELKELRHKFSHKGTPKVENGLLTLDSPAASGGASWHSMVCDDDVVRAVPGHSALFIVGSQAERTGVKQFGGGHLMGQHYVFVLPKEPLLDIQARINRDQSLTDLWPQVQEANEDFVNVDRWAKETFIYKQVVVRGVAPDIIRERMLGFQLDLTVAGRRALLSPVMAKSHYLAHADRLPGIRDMYYPFGGFFMETSDRYGKVDSMFDPPAEVA
jgi:hypothetical protein